MIKFDNKIVNFTVTSPQKWSVGGGINHPSKSLHDPPPPAEIPK